MTQKPLVFMMGSSPVFLPVDREYVATHMWAVARDGDVYRFGFTAYAVKLLGDVRALGWTVRSGQSVESGRSIGHIEASKAVSDLFAPIGGIVTALNNAVLADPTLINSNLYDDAWLFELRIAARPSLMTPLEYLAHMEKVWPLAQRLLKGQLGRGETTEGEDA